MDDLLDLIHAAERPVVRDHVARLCQGAGRFPWPRRHKSPAGLDRRVCTVVAAIAPYLPYERLALLVRYAEWTLRFDDRLDDPGTDMEAIHSVCEAVTTVTHGGQPIVANDPLVLSLMRIVESLSICDRSGLVVQQFGAALRDTVTAEIHHLSLVRAVSAGSALLPSAERYLEIATDTINYRSFAYALLTLITGGLSAQALDYVNAPIRVGAYVVRLSNDLSSVKRDNVQSRLNVLGLHTAAGEPVTPAYVRDEMRRRMREHHDALAWASWELAMPAHTLMRSLELAVALYGVTDLR